MSKITDNAFLFQKTFGTSGVNAIGSFQLSQLNSSSVQSQCPQWRYNKTFRGIYNLYRKMQKKDRLAAGYTLEKYERIYRQAFYDAAKKADPNWENRQYNSDKKIKQR